MPIIPLDNAKEGMMLAKDVTGDHGHILACKGISLNKGLIRGLVRCGIQTVAITAEQKEKALSEDAIVQIKDSHREKVLERFGGRMPADPMMKVLFETAVRIEAVEYQGNRNDDTGTH